MWSICQPRPERGTHFPGPRAANASRRTTTVTPQTFVVGFIDVLSRSWRQASVNRGSILRDSGVRAVTKKQHLAAKSGSKGDLSLGKFNNKGALLFFGPAQWQSSNRGWL